MRPIPLRGIVLAGLLAAAVATPYEAPAQAPAQAPQKPGRILGVFDDETGNPIADAEIVDLYTDATARTEKHGLAELSRFTHRNDSAAVLIRRIGYADTALVVMVGPADTVPLQVNLHRAPIDLPALVAHAAANAPRESPMMKEFDDRRKEGFGHFIDGIELRRSVDNHDFAGYLSTHFPGLTLQLGRSNAQYLIGTRAHCPVAVYIDGAALYTAGRGSGPPPDFSIYRSEDFAGVEFYSGGSTMPTEYNATGSSCGVLLLWRKYQ